MTPRTLAPCLLLAAVACSDRDAPRPVPVPEPQAVGEARPLSSRESIAPAVVPSPAAKDPDDPAEPGISDLARLARYVFRTMQRHQGICPFDNPLRDPLHFALEIEVKAGRMTRVGVGHVGVEPAGASEARTLTAAQWPPALTGYVACLEPHLKAVTMAPSPADGVYEPVYSFGGREAGEPAP